MSDTASDNITENTRKKTDPMMDDEYILKKLFPDYVSLYRIELNSGKYEILRVAKNTNAIKIVGKEQRIFASYDEFTKHYADAFILEEDREEFIEWHSCKNIKKQLMDTDRITYHYHSVSADGTDSYYEAYAVRGQSDDNSFYAFMGYRNIDSILYKEKAIQEKLQKALDEVKLSNEIVSAIARTYQYISRIDIRKDWFEEIANRDKEHLNFVNSGVMSEGNKKVCREFVAEEYQEAFFKFTDLTTLPERMKDEETIVMEYKMKDGDWHKLRFIEKKRDEDGKLTHVLCVIRSISAAKKREQELLYQVAEAKKDAALKTQFLSNMSHDIRTPMNGIIGMVEIANRYPDDPQVQQSCRDKLLESSRCLVSIVNNILDMNKLENGDFVDRKVPFNLAVLLNRANNDKQMLAEKKQVDYVVDWGKADLKHVYLTGNPVYLEKALGVIADNAVKFTNPGGSVHVWCAERSVNEERVVYEFGCSDNGIGMSEEFAGHAFEMFAQENKTSRTKCEGTGLGLAIAEKMVESLGGTIEIKSKKGQGTTVLMTIPFAIAKPWEEPAVSKKVELTEEAQDLNEISLAGMRALVVEDNELNMEIAKFMLEEHGICVECAADGLEAVERFTRSETNYYDVIFMDIMMPNMNGWDAARKIRAMERSDAIDVPIIAMSANAFAEDIINSRISGINRHIAKPLDDTKLLNALRECVRDKNG